MRIETLPFVACALAGAAAFSQEAPVEEKLEAISESVVQAMEANDIPAVSLGIVWRDEVHFIHHGSPQRGANERVTSESLYQLASLSKTFVGIVAHQLVTEETLGLEDSIIRHLPGLTSEARAKLEKVTVSDLLHHTSGLPRDSMARGDDRDVTSLEYDTDDLMQELESVVLEAPSGGGFRYSNFGYSLLAHVCEQAAATPYEELLRKHVTARYGLKDTGFTLTAEQEPRRVTAYHNVQRDRAVAPVTLGKLGPPTTMYSTVRDLTTLMRAQLRDYRASEGSRVLVLTKARDNDQTGITYGYGFFDWGDGTLGHGGGMDGFGSEYHICPKGDFGATFLTSSCGLWTPRLSNRIHAILRGDHGETWTPFDPTERITQVFETQGQEAALKLYSELRAAVPSPLDVGTRLSLARAAKATGDVQLIRMILQHAREDFPDSDEIAAAWKRLEGR